MARMQIVGLSSKCGLIVCALVAVGVFEGSARAQGTTEHCYVENNVRICGAPNGTTTNGVIAVVGSDPWGNWVGWKDYTTYECLGWDQIGDTNGFYNAHTIISGTSFTDYLGTVVGEDYDFCGFPLDPPINPNGILTLDAWFGGQDFLEANASFHVNMECYNGDGCSFYLGGTGNPSSGNIYGSEANDFVLYTGQGNWNFYTYGGNDQISNWTSVSPTNGDCGDGTEDSFTGMRQGTPLSGCETIN